MCEQLVVSIGSSKRPYGVAGELVRGLVAKSGEAAMIRASTVGMTGTTGAAGTVGTTSTTSAVGTMGTTGFRGVTGSPGRKP